MSTALFVLGVLLCLLVIAVVLVLAFAVVPAYRVQLQYRRQGVPCAPFIPVIGHIRRLARYHSEDRAIQFYYNARDRWGLVHAMSFGPVVRLTCDDPRYLPDILSASHAAKFHKPFLTRLLLGGLLGHENTLLTEGAEHSAHRRMVSPAFHHHNLVEMAELMVNETEGHIHQWLTSTSKEETDLGRAMSALTLSIIAACAFGRAFNSMPNAHAVVYGAMEKGMKLNQRRLFTLVEVTPVLRSLPIMGKTERDETRRQLRELVDVVVKERKEGKTSSLREGKLDLLDLLLSAKDEDTGKEFTATEGHETTSTLMTHALYVLATRPSLWSDCLREVLSVCGDSAPTPSDLSQLPVVDAVLQETLRYLSPVPLMTRQVHTATTIGTNTGKPLHLPVGALVQIHMCVIHRLKEFWGPDAETWDHTRWLKAKKPYTHPYAFLPFNLGPRNCVGQSFALMEARLMLVMILQRCRIEVVPGQKVDANGWPITQPAVTLRPKYGIKVKIQPRPVDERKEH